MMNDQENTKNGVPIKDKFALTIKEASAYFGVGENKIRSLIKEHNCDFVFYVGRKALIKRLNFEKYLEKMVWL